MPENKRNAGRHKAEDPKDKRIALRLTSSEYEQVIEKADEAGKTLSAYCKEKILK